MPNNCWKCMLNVIQLQAKQKRPVAADVKGHLEAALVERWTFKLFCGCASCVNTILVEWVLSSGCVGFPASGAASL